MAVTLNGSASPPFDDADVRCSVVPFPGARSGDLFFVGIALADTALVGPGSVKASEHGGHLGNGRFLVTDALAWDIAWSGEPKRRLLGIGLMGVFSALVHLARARHARPADDLLTRLRSGSQ